MFVLTNRLHDSAGPAASTATDSAAEQPASTQRNTDLCSTHPRSMESAMARQTNLVSSCGTTKSTCPACSVCGALQSNSRRRRHCPSPAQCASSGDAVTTSAANHRQKGHAGIDSEPPRKCSRCCHKWTHCRIAGVVDGRRQTFDRTCLRCARNHTGQLCPRSLRPSQSQRRDVRRHRHRHRFRLSCSAGAQSCRDGSDATSRDCVVANAVGTFRWCWRMVVALCWSHLTRSNPMGTLRCQWRTGWVVCRLRRHCWPL